MANEQQVELLKKGVEGWNQWREAHPEESIDFSEADLRGLNLSGANLKNADLNSAKLQFSNLSQAQLDAADLSRARMQEVNLQQAQLPGAKVSNCNMMESNVAGANFEGADLSGCQFNEETMFINTNIKGANLDNASGLHPANIQGALRDADTKLPDYLTDDLDDEEFLNSFL